MRAAPIKSRQLNYFLPGALQNPLNFMLFVPILFKLRLYHRGALLGGIFCPSFRQPLLPHPLPASSCYQSLVQWPKGCNRSSAVYNVIRVWNRDFSPLSAVLLFRKRKLPKQTRKTSNNLRKKSTLVAFLLFYLLYLQLCVLSSRIYSLNWLKTINLSRK